MPPRIYLFDMDHTLQDNDADVSWKSFLVREKLAPPDALKTAEMYFEQYQRGQLSIENFLRFQLAEFVGRTPEEMKPLLQKHFNEYCRDKIYPDAVKLIAKCRADGGRLAVLTSTNRQVAAPLAEFLGFDDLLAYDLELVDGRFTGNMLGEYSAGTGKVGYARDYCRRHGFELCHAAYYGDAISDRFILEAVGFPNAVNPVPELRELAAEKQWPVIELH